MSRSARSAVLILTFFAFFPRGATGAEKWGTGALMVIVEREAGGVTVVDSVRHKVLGRVAGLGVMHHASISFSRDARFAFVVTRDGWLNKVDLLDLRVASRVRVGSSTIGLTVTQDGRRVAVSNYDPPDVRIYDVETLVELAVIPALREKEGTTIPSRTVGLVNAPGNLLVFSLMDADGIWVVDAGKPGFPVVKKFWDVGRMPFDGVLASDGRTYIAGLFHSPWMARLDTWKLDGVSRVSLSEPDKSYDKHPVLKIPHLKGWSEAAGMIFAPVVGEKRLAVFRAADGTFVRSVPLAGTPVFAVARPDGREIWVNFNGDDADTIQVVDVESLSVAATLKPGKRIFHMAFTPKGEAAYVSANKSDQVVVYDTSSKKELERLSIPRPSGIFGTDRAHKFGL
ncbi:MAG: protein nirF [Nitrospirae bacterium]|nr:protein nirF [Nitrospirota bacterium]